VTRSDEFDNISQEKRDYAALLIKERDPFKAALLLFPEATNRALWVSNNWPNDPEVVAEKDRLNREDAGAAYLLNKTELARDILEKMKVAVKADDYAKLAKLYAEVLGYIEKPQASVNVTNNVPRVVEMPVFPTGEDWEAAAAKQQRDLLANARTRH
jgi:hypothetical protein